MDQESRAEMILFAFDSLGFTKEVICKKCGGVAALKSIFTEGDKISCVTYRCLQCGKAHMEYNSAKRRKKMGIIDFKRTLPPKLKPTGFRVLR